MDNIRQFIDQLAAGENSDAKETIENVLSNKSFEALENKKKELATTIFNGVANETETAE